MKPRLQTDRLVIRPAGTADAPAVLEFLRRNRAFHRPFEPRRPAGHYQLTRVRQSIVKGARDRQKGHGLLFYLFDRNDRKKVHGLAALNNIVGGAFQACHLGYMLAKDSQGKGLMHEALQAIVRYAFDEMNLHRLMANYLPHNQRSAALLRKLGFQKEGLAKAYLRINGRWQDHVLTSLINPRWVSRNGQ